MTKKYRVEVYTKAWASKPAGFIECDSIEDYNEQLDDRINEFLEEGNISIYACNDFDVGDTEIVDDLKEEDLKYFLINK